MKSGEQTGVVPEQASEQDARKPAAGKSSERKSITLSGSGHIGLAIGGRAQRELWPQACDWLAQRTD